MFGDKRRLDKRDAKLEKNEDKKVTAAIRAVDPSGNAKRFRVSGTRKFIEEQAADYRSLGYKSVVVHW